MKSVRLIRTDASATLVWEITWDYLTVETALGKQGESPMVDYCTLASEESVDKYVRHQIEERRADGFIEPAGDSGSKGQAATVAREPELERRCADNPDDVESFLVYADWLESRGDPRGQLITLQAARTLEPERGDLIDAEARLLTIHAEHFVPEYGQGTIETGWRLGFLDAARVATIDSLRALLVHPSSVMLRSLRIDLVASADEIAELLVTAPAISRLRSIDVRLRTEHGAARRILAVATGLTELRVTGSHVLAEADTSRLESLSYLNATLDEETAGELCAERWPRLTSLELGFSGVRYRDTGSFDPLWTGMPMPLLRELSLHSSVLIEPLFASPLLGQLDVLRLTNCSLEDYNVASWFSEGVVEKFANLKVLDLRHNWLSVDMEQSIANQLERGIETVLLRPQDRDEFDDDDEYADDYEDDHYYEDDRAAYSADIVPVYEDEVEEREGEAERNLEIDKTWERGVVGFDHDDD